MSTAIPVTPSLSGEVGPAPDRIVIVLLLFTVLQSTVSIILPAIGLG